MAKLANPLTTQAQALAVLSRVVEQTQTLIEALKNSTPEACALDEPVFMQTFLERGVLLEQLNGWQADRLVEPASDELVALMMQLTEMEPQLQAGLQNQHQKLEAALGRLSREALAVKGYYQPLQAPEQQEGEVFLPEGSSHSQQA